MAGLRRLGHRGMGRLAQHAIYAVIPDRLKLRARELSGHTGTQWLSKELPHAFRREAIERLETG